MGFRSSWASDGWCLFELKQESGEGSEAMSTALGSEPETVCGEEKNRGESGCANTRAMDRAGWQMWYVWAD